MITTTMMMMMTMTMMHWVLGWGNMLGLILDEGSSLDDEAMVWVVVHLEDGVMYLRVHYRCIMLVQRFAFSVCNGVYANGMGDALVHEADDTEPLLSLE